jgi:hypothetical protein
MKSDLRTIKEETTPISILFCAGFEERALRAASLLYELSVSAETIGLLRYSGDEDADHYTRLAECCGRLVKSAQDIEPIAVSDSESIAKWIQNKTNAASLILCDVTGMSRLAMFAVLLLLKQSKRKFWLIYTEAQDYYPKREQFDPFLRTSDPSEAFMRLTQYEETEIVYSGNCRVEEIPGFAGVHLPNYPLMLMAFLTFKRSRVGAVLREYEANVRVLIKSVPLREDLKWRERAMETINFDLIEDNRSSIKRVTTLRWVDTYKILEAIYNENNNRYKYNFLLAPLGSKMQTVGAWVFSIKNPKIKVVTATPAKLFRDKYSDGFGDTFLIDDLPFNQMGA